LIGGTAVPGEREAVERRGRRLNQLRKGQYVVRANAALQKAWNKGRRPAGITLRRELLLSDPEPPPLTQLLHPRGVALRFYLLAVFEARCRLDVGQEWTREGGPPWKGPGSWADFIAIDGAYDEASGDYVPYTNTDRDMHTLRVQQIHGALRTLEGLGSGGQQALVQVPRRPNGYRDYKAFSLMKESGRGAAQTPDRYTVPASTWDSSTFTVPSTFFLKGWVHVLHPSEVATWLIFQWMSQRFPDNHAESGVYLNPSTRQRYFRLRRDSYEDACNRLRDFGLIRDAQPGSGGPSEAGPQSGGLTFADIFSQPAPVDRYEVHHYQVTNEGLTKDALATCVKETILRRNDLKKRRAGSKDADVS
jgi:hypothetical protein